MFASGHGTNSQLGQVLPTVLPSKHTLASISHACGLNVPVVSHVSTDHVSVGQGTNSQFGPDLPTALPSGQILASSVHAWGTMVFVVVHPVSMILSNRTGMISFLVMRLYIMRAKKKIKSD